MSTSRRDTRVLAMLAAGAVVVAVVVVLVVRGVVDSPLSGLAQLVPGAPEPQTLEEMSQELNASLPAMVDPQTRLDETYVEGREFHYRYTLMGDPAAYGDGAALTRRLGPHLRSSACGSSEMRDFLSPDVTAVYTYLDEVGRTLTQIRVSLEDCG